MKRMFALFVTFVTILLVISATASAFNFDFEVEVFQTTVPFKNEVRLYKATADDPIATFPLPSHFWQRGLTVSETRDMCAKLLTAYTGNRPGDTVMESLDEMLSQAPSQKDVILRSNAPDDRLIPIENAIAILNSLLATL